MKLPPSLPPFTPSVLAARGRGNLELVPCLAKRDKLITVKTIYVNLQTHHEEFRGVFLASSYIVSGIHPAQLPKTIPLNQVLRKLLHLLLLPKGLNMGREPG